MEGKVFYVEFPSLDVDRATRFWNGVMGWNFGNQVFEQYDYRMAQIAADAAVAVQPAVEQGPNVYMETPDLESALERVKELGGTAGGDKGHSTAAYGRTTRGGAAWSLRCLQGQ